ncbi:CBS domain-containing protein [Sphingomonas colocasiae]|uniref:CBS domain-containing protein n=1 Tax=Sphingomonas colocasiae TaxID=1848973 RepID=A0ABS7PXJ4_9SPHN|nr:CBS domain-containing protein [Sphingomonas colocasiae]MBY8825360.1 CBS domain-containing protein [Sphingomonas colocasiae]
MTIRKVVEGNPHTVITIGVDASVADAVALLAEKRIGALPVVEGGAVVGVFSERDVIYCLARDGAAALGRSVREAMTAPVITVDLDHPAIGALSMMTRRRIRHLPVIDGGALVGFVSIGDLVKHRIDRIESEAAAMRDYIQSA